MFGCGTIGLGAAVALKYFGMDKVMLCDVSDFRLRIAENLGFAVCNTETDDFIKRAADYFGTAASLTGMVPKIDCWIDAAGAESIPESFMQHGKIISRFVSVAVNNKPRQLDLLHMTYAQKSIISSGGYFPEDVRDIMKIMASGKWNLESIITQIFPLERISEAINRGRPGKGF
ncbi:MAG: zinc-binding dehydrogenase [Eubacteriales bacterium]|nr:zinc-binding dehydrogenase [Eubacteriales bacterium]